MTMKSPRYRPAGERAVLVELDDQVTLSTNAKAITLAKALMSSSPLGPKDIRAIVDVVPSFTTVLIHYNPELLTYQGLKQICDYYLQQLSQQDRISLDSRLIDIPVTYKDRWCRACFEDYCNNIKPIEDNIELVCRLNGLSSLEDLITLHTTTEWWVGATGFIAGLPTLTPLDAKIQLQAPKYDPPRTWTPKGTVGLGGGFTTIYPVVIPDGYQMIGRTPVPIFDAGSHQEPFQSGPLLFQVGDRVQFHAISEDEFESIEQDVAAARYRYSISEPEVFSYALS